MKQVFSTRSRVFFRLERSECYVTILGYSVEDWIALATFLGGIVFGLMKFYALFTNMDKTLAELNKTIQTNEDRFSEHNTRITRLEEQNKTIFKRMERNDHD